MDSRQRIARRELLEHQAIAKRIRTDHRTLINYARNNTKRWAANFAADSVPGWLVEWQQLLAGPLDELLSILAADTQEAAQLRATSPFVGVLTLQEKLKILRWVDPEMARTLALFERTRDQSADGWRVQPNH